MNEELFQILSNSLFKSVSENTAIKDIKEALYGDKEGTIYDLSHKIDILGVRVTYTLRGEVTSEFENTIGTTFQGFSEHLSIDEVIEISLHEVYYFKKADGISCKITIKLTEEQINHINENL